jgi:hypothetical protein
MCREEPGAIWAQTVTTEEGERLHLSAKDPALPTTHAAEDPGLERGARESQGTGHVVPRCLPSKYHVQRLRRHICSVTVLQIRSQNRSPGANINCG